MWAVTGWAAITWAKLTTVLALVLVVCWWQLDPVGFAVACAGAAFVQLWLIGALAGEWAAEARSSWWWTT
ncbi:MAG: hypothetical protein ACRDRK_01230 [Pseudonocardia sp.]